MKYWYLIFLLVFALFVNTNRSLFHAHEFQGADLSTVHPWLWGQWWIYLLVILILLLIKYLHERQGKK